MFSRTTLCLLCLAVAAAANLGAGALPEGEVELVMDLAADQNPEGVAVDKSGNVFFSLAYLGEIWKLTPRGEGAVFYSGLDGSGLGVTGLAVDAPGNVYVAVASLNPATRGVYRISRDGTACDLLPGTDALEAADGLAFDKRGNLFITDTGGGAIYRVPRGGSAELWLSDPLLAGTGAFGFPVPIGANGIQYWKNSLIVANTEQVLILRVPVLPDGSPGAPEVLYSAFDPVTQTFWFVPDGIALDVHGNVYVADPGYSQIVFVAADGSWAATMAAVGTGSLLDNPTSLAFGTGKGDRKNIFIANADLIDDGIPIGPSLVKMGAGAPGNPLP